MKKKKANHPGLRIIKLQNIFFFKWGSLKRLRSLLSYF